MANLNKFTNSVNDLDIFSIGSMSFLIIIISLFKFFINC